MPLIRTTVWLAGKDLRVELRSRTSLWSAVVLATVAVVIVGLSMTRGEIGRAAVVPPLLWISTLYAALLIGDRLESIDQEDDARAWLWLTLEDRPAVFLGKVVACAVLLTVVLLWTWVATIVLLDVAVSAALPLVVAVSGLVALSTSSVVILAATLVAPAAQRSLLLPVVTMPLLIPTSIAGAQAARGLLDPDATSLAPWLAILGVETLLFCGIGLLTYELIGGAA
ncbi:MAG: heme exporter protein CcmB [Candidatus Limnocylindria bacterium]